MGVTLELDGIGILRRQLEQMPRILTEDAMLIGAKGARAAAAAVLSQYASHRYTGNLAKGVVVQVVPGERGKVVHKVASRAFHSHLFEEGTVVRKNKKQANRGKVDGAKVMATTMPAYRAAFYRDIKAMMERYGLTVTGDA